jgi:signal transduction histidine kinase
MTKILIIEDETDILDNIRTILELEGYGTQVAENGRIGLNIAEREKPDLILCDVTMPEMDGYTVLRKLRQNEATASIPFIFLTSRALPQDFRLGMQLGADDYLFKPFSVDELLQTISTRLERYAATQLLERRIQELERLNQSKDDFLGLASHEIRNPLTNMLIAAKMLQTFSEPEKQQRYLKLLYEECLRSVDLVQDLLEIHKLEADSYELSITTIDLVNVVQSIVDSYSLRMQERQLTLNVVLPAPLQIASCPTALMRIANELLGNACKYTSAGDRIDLKVSCDLETGRTEDVLTLVVRNQAEIPAVELPHLFDKFYRASNATSSKQVGTGLGLAAIQKLVERLGGSIAVDSSEGWTQFTVRVPVRVEEKTLG